jgi:hypothetical protein
LDMGAAPEYTTYADAADLLDLVSVEAYGERFESEWSATMEVSA